jgi:Pup amidohydrolase
MLRPILAGIETEYGLLVEGRGAADQVDDAMALVRSYQDECHVGWDYRYESPRSDLRGFKLDRLAIDPEDAKFDAGRKFGEAHEIRSDRVLPNGARLYNDHGHPEYSTPECFGLQALALSDFAGQTAVRRAGQAFAAQTGLEVKLFKNNTDFHGSSYGTHESYLVPRSLGYEKLFQDLLPMMVVRQILSGAGKVGAETGAGATYQLSQRADFFVEPANAETLYRRPIFNTRDESHADSSEWIRLHVICGDANLIPAASARKVGLIKLALYLSEVQEAPLWRFADPVKAFQQVSRDESYAFEIPLVGQSRTNAYEVLESYFAAAEAVLDLDEDMRWTIDSSRVLLDALRAQDFGAFRREVDWAAKKYILEEVISEGQTSWRDESLRAYDLEYHNIDPDASLHVALADMAIVESNPSDQEVSLALQNSLEPTRALARGLAIQRFPDELMGVCWRSLTFKGPSGPVEVELHPNVSYPENLRETKDVGTFIELLKGIKP